MLPYITQELRRLSQDEGMTDKEIADILGCSRPTVNRARKTAGIPTANLSNRKDKEYTCNLCNTLITIRRKERKKKYCPDCKESLQTDVK